ncbi:B-cell linker protein [Electrophorus electricus]|uniref:SH2 domain-containing protein n=1 Tax=Electrophorus electricus TaxID=8005 RepID=A0A4W4EKM3_ELEEL|nr:B-cell linker protein [Electrophorus electricus]
METLSKITAPASEKLRQLQKIVQDIKKNDDSIFNRLKRFQNEQTANILKTGRNTLDRIKNKGPPKVPARDYPGDDQAEWSGSEFDSDVYEDPQGEHDDNYEPPPCEEVFTPAPATRYHAGEYLDSRPGRMTQTKPTTAIWPIKPSIPEKPSPDRPMKNEEDYVHPEEIMDDDNYIDPSEKDHADNRENQHFPRRSDSPDVYEVPDNDDSPGISRCSTKMQLPPLRLPPTPSPRMNTRKPISCLEPEEEEDYEVCNDEGVTKRPEKTVKDSKPRPLPRELNHPKPPFFQKASIPAKANEAAPKSVARDSANHGAGQPTKVFYRMKMPMPCDSPSQKFTAAERGSLSQEDIEAREQEQKAGVFNKPWYTSTCHRKTAEDILIRSAKDGSYLVRKSSGLDALQPYTLVVFYNSRVYNIPVRYIPDTKQYALGKQKSREERFNSVSEIIENHQRNTLVLVDTQSHTKDSTKLRHALTP